MIVAALFPHAVERPGDHKPAIRAEAVEEMLDDVMKQESIPENEREQTRKALADAFEHHEDGYKAAKTLEDQHGWDPDASLVDTLDSFHGYLWDAHRKAVKAWVNEYGIKPQFNVGDRVQATWGYEEITGTIRSIDTDVAQYTIQRTPDENGGAIVNFEDTREAP
jgi:hypothetical protein